MIISLWGKLQTTFYMISHHHDRHKGTKHGIICCEFIVSICFTRHNSLNYKIYIRDSFFCHAPIFLNTRYHSLASAIPPVVIANVASFSGKSGLKSLQTKNSRKIF